MEKRLTFIEIPASGRIDDALPDIARSVCESTADLYRAIGFHSPWTGYLAKDDCCYIGTCAFKAPPENRCVEIAYFTFPGFEGKGYATQMAQHLIHIARHARPDSIILAQTLPEENASTTILKKLNFRLKGTQQHPEDGTIWEWELS
jgi:RimJ/RimL family protein N-acetyltransferase